MSEKSLEEAWRKIETLSNDRDVDKLVWQKIQTSMAEMSGQLTELREAVGYTSTDERGQPIGTGIKGDVMRIRIKVDQKFGMYEGMVKYATGALMAASIAIGVVWWLVQDRVDFLK